MTRRWQALKKETGENIMLGDFFYEKVLFIIRACSFLALSSCGNAAEGEHIGPTQYSTPEGWKSICIDRYLLDLPETIDMGAVPARYKAAYQFEGTPFGASGPSYAGNKISETVPTEINSYKNIYYSVKKKLISNERYGESIKRIQSDFLEWKKLVGKNDGDMTEAIRNTKNIADKKISNLRYLQKVSGEIPLGDKNSFAIRQADEFSIAYYDPLDKRVRMVEGKIGGDLAQSPAAVAEKFIEFKKVYERRLPTEIPTKPGFCTNFGFLSESNFSESNTNTEMVFRSKKYPNLIFQLLIEPAEVRSVQNIQKLPHMDAENAKLDLIGIKKAHGPIPVQILGAPGRVFGQEYGDNCSATSCRPADQLYDFEAETFGEPGRPDRPHLILNMKAATADDYRLKLPPQENEPSYNTPTKPALSGTVPPPFAEGKLIFEQVLRSIRARPGALLPSVSTPAVQQHELK